jgi:hypothetical protein
MSTSEELCIKEDCKQIKSAVAEITMTADSGLSSAAIYEVHIYVSDPHLRFRKTSFFSSPHLGSHGKMIITDFIFPHVSNLVYKAKGKDKRSVMHRCCLKKKMKRKQ